MSTELFPGLATFTVGNHTAAGGTAFAAVIPAYRGAAGSAPVLQKAGIGSARAITRIQKVVYTTGANKHTLTFMRPLNWALVTAAVAHNAAVVSVDKDPGVYSTNYRYPLPSGVSKPAGSADNAIAAGDWVLVQLKDGTWHMSTVDSVSGLAVTLDTATPDVAGGGIDAGTRLFFFGVPDDEDPATGLAHVQTITTASTNRADILPVASGAAGVAALHQGDPMILHSDNDTAQGWLDLVTGSYTSN